MKTLSKLAVLFPLVAACGGATNVNANAVETECSLTLRANATAADLRQAVNDVLEGSTDPCGGAVDNFHVATVSLQRIDNALQVSNQRAFTLVFRVSSAPQAR